MKSNHENIVICHGYSWIQKPGRWLKRFQAPVLCPMHENWPSLVRHSIHTPPAEGKAVVLSGADQSKYMDKSSSVISIKVSEYKVPKFRDGSSKALGRQSPQGRGFSARLDTPIRHSHYKSKLYDKPVVENISTSVTGNRLLPPIKIHLLVIVQNYNHHIVILKGTLTSACG